ncbi:CrcB family protein [Salinarchaeum chitinilyticum]
MAGTRRVAPPGLLVALGGFAGAVSRYGVDVAVGGSLLSTLLVNVLGSFTLALVLTSLLDATRTDSTGRRQRSSVRVQRLRRFGATGFLSSFTTYSTFVVGAIQQSPAVAVGYVTVTYAVGFAAAGLGIAVVRRWGEPR